MYVGLDTVDRARAAVEFCDHCQLMRSSAAAMLMRCTHVQGQRSNDRHPAARCTGAQVADVATA